VKYAACVMPPARFEMVFGVACAAAGRTFGACLYVSGRRMTCVAPATDATARIAAITIAVCLENPEGAMCEEGPGIDNEDQAEVSTSERGIPIRPTTLYQAAEATQGASGEIASVDRTLRKHMSSDASILIFPPRAKKRRSCQKGPTLVKKRVRDHASTYAYAWTAGPHALGTMVLWNDAHRAHQPHCGNAGYGCIVEMGAMGPACCIVHGWIVQRLVSYCGLDTWHLNRVSR
jgi:hypothetical protein